MRVVLSWKVWQFVLAAIVMMIVAYLFFIGTSLSSYIQSFMNSCMTFLSSINQLDLPFVLGYLLLLGAGAIGFTRALYILSKEIWGVSRLKRNAQSRVYTIQRKVRFTLDQVPYAMTVGYFLPVTYVSDSLVDMCTQEELDAIMFHEAIHRKHRDPLKKLLVAVLVEIVFVIPSFRTLKSVIHEIHEHRADAGIPSHLVASLTGKVAGKQFAYESVSQWSVLRSRIEGNARIAAKVTISSLATSIVVLFFGLVVTQSVQAKEGGIDAPQNVTSQGYCQALLYTPDTGMSELPMSVE